jgi:hypothetical protein
VIALGLRELEAAEKVEDLLEGLDVPYDGHVVAVHRTRLLRLLGRAVAALPESLLQAGDDALRTAVRRALQDAYAGLSDDLAGRPTPGVRDVLVQLGRPGTEARAT